MKPRQEIMDAHKLSSKHIESVKSSSKCGCFYCVSTFSPRDIREWVDASDTALCPRCGIDSVLPESDKYATLDLDFLREMSEYWFSCREWDDWH